MVKLSALLGGDGDGKFVFNSIVSCCILLVWLVALAAWLASDEPLSGNPLVLARESVAWLLSVDENKEYATKYLVVVLSMLMRKAMLMRKLA